MARLLILLAALAPPLLVLSYGIAKTRGSWRSEAMWNAIVLGAMSVLAAVVFEFVLGRLLAVAHMNPLSSAAAKALLVAAIPEEGIKFFVLLAIVQRHVDVRRLQDIVLLAVAVSLGFATLENFFYVASIGDWKTTAALRAITSVPGHGIDGLTMGALLVASPLRADTRPLLLIAALVVPVLLHAAYDFPLLANGKGGHSLVLGAIWLLVIACSSVFAIVLCNRVLIKATAVDRALGRDGASIETTDRLIGGGLVALFAGPALSAALFYAKGFDVAAATAALSILPIAMGIDAIFTGLRRRRERNAQLYELYCAPRPASYG